jgi:hypothetical protein
MNSNGGSNHSLEEICSILAQGYLRLQQKAIQNESSNDNPHKTDTKSKVLALDRVATTPDRLNSTVNENPNTRRSSND